MQQVTIESEILNLIKLLPESKRNMVKEFLEFLVYKSKDINSFEDTGSLINLSEWKDIRLQGVSKDCMFDREFIYSDTDRGT